VRLDRVKFSGGERGAPPFELPVGARDADTLENHLPDGQPRLGGVRHLRQVADRPGPPDAPAVRRLEAGQDPEQRRLAGTVGADHADARSGVHSDVDAVENRPDGVAPGYLLRVEQCSHVSELVESSNQLETVSARPPRGGPGHRRRGAISADGWVRAGTRFRTTARNASVPEAVGIQSASAW
jgi:hypothetical protein